MSISWTRISFQLTCDAQGPGPPILPVCRGTVRLPPSSWPNSSPGRTTALTPTVLSLIADLLQEVTVLDFDQCLRTSLEVKGELLQQGVSIPVGGSDDRRGALVHDLTLVTHNTADFQNIPGLRLEDWLTP